jgi:zinc D-Ala-D-Ala carboxypeptidase
MEDGMRRIFVAVIAAGLAVVPAGLATAQASAAAGTPAAAQVASANWPIVGRGARGERVRVIQLLLNQRGAHVAVDGVFGSADTTAVKAFQRKVRVTADGIVGPATWTKLVVTIRRGSRGDAVRALQHQLRFQYRYRSVKVDGVFGAATETAVKSFQRRRRLAVDGIVGTGTWKALETG